MAQDPSNAVSFYMRIALSQKEDLGNIRNWELLKIGYEDSFIWVKDLSAAQIDSVEVKSIPFKKIYYAVDQQLFPIGSLLPEGSVPTLLWTPIERGLPLQLPSYNHNYFGISDKVAVKLVPSDIEQSAFALLADLKSIKTYILTAPAVRLQNLDWVIVGTYALLLRTPLLPLQGITYWCLGTFLIPTGYRFEFPILSHILEQLLNPDQDHWIVWDKEGSYWVIPKISVEALSISSYRQSIPDTT